MVSMMQCKSCSRSAATRVIEDCGHLICERCIHKRKRCGKCKREITLTHIIFFAGTNSDGRKFSGAWDIEVNRSFRDKWRQTYFTYTFGTGVLYTQYHVNFNKIDWAISWRTYFSHNIYICAQANRQTISDKSLLRDKVYFACLQTCIIIYRNMYRRILRTLDW